MNFLIETDSFRFHSNTVFAITLTEGSQRVRLRADFGLIFMRVQLKYYNIYSKQKLRRELENFSTLMYDWKNASIRKIIMNDIESKQKWHKTWQNYKHKHV